VGKRCSAGKERCGGEILRGTALAAQQNGRFAEPEEIRGRAEIEQRLDRAAANFRDGEVVGFETITRLVTPELAYLLEVERSKAKVGGSDELTRTDIRVTTLFRPEAGAWKVVHRHADPAVDAKPAHTAFQR